MKTKQIIRLWLTAWGRFLPVASALVITVLGVVLTAGAVMSLGL